MKTFNKLLATITLAVGLIIAPSLHTWPTRLYILYNKKNNHINCIWGDCHAENSEEKNEARWFQTSQKHVAKLIRNKKVNLILELRTNEIERIKKFMYKNIPKMSLLNQLAFVSGQASTCYADWRCASFFHYLITFAENISKIIQDAPDEILQALVLKGLTSLDRNDTESAEQAYNLLQEVINNNPPSSEPNMNCLIEEMTGIDHQEIKNVLCQFYLHPIESFIKSNEAMIKQIQQTQFINTYMNEWAKKITKDLTDTNLEYKKYRQNMPLIWKMFAQTICEGDLTPFFTKDSFVRTYKWLKTWMDDVADFGFITEIIKARTTHPITITYVGAAHAEVVAKYFTEQEGYACEFKEIDPEYEYLDTKAYEGFFTRLEKLTQEKLTTKKRTIEDDSSNRTNAKKKKL